MLSQGAIRIGTGKVIRIGGSLYVHLPVLWHREHGISEGKEMDMFSAGGPILLVKPSEDANDGGGSE